MGMMLGPANTDAVNRASTLSYGEATGITQTIRNLGASLGLAVLGTILLLVQRSKLTASFVASTRSQRGKCCRPYRAIPRRNIDISHPPVLPLGFCGGNPSRPLRDVRNHGPGRSGGPGRSSTRIAGSAWRCLAVVSDMCRLSRHRAPALGRRPGRRVGAR